MDYPPLDPNSRFGDAMWPQNAGASPAHFDSRSYTGGPAPAHAHEQHMLAVSLYAHEGVPRASPHQTPQMVVSRSSQHNSGNASPLLKFSPDEQQVLWAADNAAACSPSAGSASGGFQFETHTGV